MPGASGFDVIDAVGAAACRSSIFVTAFDNYALRAFDVHALDYLLKPFDRDRFQQALTARANSLERRSDGELERRLLALVHGPQAGHAAARALRRQSPADACSSSGPSEIEWIEAAGNYVKLHVGAESHLFRETMNAVEAKLDPDAVLPHPPLPHRQHRARAGAAALVQRRVRRSASRAARA